MSVIELLIRGEIIYLFLLFANFIEINMMFLKIFGQFLILGSKLVLGRFTIRLSGVAAYISLFSMSNTKLIFNQGACEP
jgi:hypothetical protein